MKIWTLLENTTETEGLQTEHGLSLYVETQHHRILFDAGQSGAFAVNAEKMGIDLEKVDIAVLSHGHYDHGGGLQRFLEINSTAPVYVNQRAFMPYFNGTKKYIGLDQELLRSNRLIFTKEQGQLDMGISLHSCNDKLRSFPTDSSGLNMVKYGNFQPDDFRHEQYLLIEEHGKRTLFSGCSHKGILNIETWFQPDVLIGGFHFSKLEPRGAGAGRLKEAARILKQYDTQYYTGHCTGAEQYWFMKKIMEDRLSYVSAGSSITIS